MSHLILLDSAPLGYLCNPRNIEKTRFFKNKLKDLEVILYLPEIIDYELRRNLELEGFSKSINLLDQFRQRHQILWLESDDFLKAAELWSWCRKEGYATTENKGIDIDVILVSQALSQLRNFYKVIILTADIGDLSIFCELEINLWNWKTALADCELGRFDFL